MSIFSAIYLNLSKGRFRKEFNPLGKNLKNNYLVSAPDNVHDFLLSLPLLTGLGTTGKIVMLTPKRLENLFRVLKKNLFINIYYQHELSLFSKEFKEIKERLKSESFHFLIELNQRANISLPYLIPVAKRVCYYQNDAFPYYNILMSGGTKSFEDFFNVEKSDIENLFHFKKRDLSAIFKRINKKRPFLFVNGENHIPWEGDRIVCGKDVLTDDIAIYHILYLCDSYYGRRDEFYELAKIFQKEIIEDKNL